MFLIYNKYNSQEDVPYLLFRIAIIFKKDNLLFILSNKFKIELSLFYFKWKNCKYSWNAIIIWNNLCILPCIHIPILISINWSLSNKIKVSLLDNLIIIL